ncbi:hypothetical protein U8C32_02625 [Sinorhizobium medicae]|uniref:hypothetical protein n=1 Tax=Sinorhizobium medicae TaxID=110321 RepID=UPI0002EF3A96|nr:hypothetical protein [Sinorhizobium medicae]WQO92537.1 hypothetical protein U8C32_02625 [Sinorhizobium medicae]
MPNKPVLAAAEGLPDSTAIAYGEARTGVQSRALIRAVDTLHDASDFCEAIFMAAVNLEGPEEVRVFQRLAQAAKNRIRAAILTIDAVRGIPEVKQ